MTATEKLSMLDRIQAATGPCTLERELHIALIFAVCLRAKEATP